MLFHIKPLQGAIVNSPDSRFSLSRWFSGDFQKEKELFVNDEFGFRELFIRVNNQISYTLFHTAHAQGIVIGKNNYLYEHGYIYAYYGSDFLGDSIIMHRMKKLQYVNTVLAKLHKTLILVFAPGKGSFYPEYIPDEDVQKRRRTNHDSYVSYANEFGINCIDLYSYFIKNKTKFKYPIFPKYGVHWSSYTDCLVADSLIRYIEHARNIHMPHILWSDIELGPPKLRDADAEDAMNMLFRLKPDTLAYPRIQYESGIGKTKPSALVIADSYFNGMYDMGIFNCFSKSDLWYYNREVSNEDIYVGCITKPFWRLDRDLLDDYIYLRPHHDGITLTNAIAKHDVIIIVATDGSLRDFGWNFIESTYDLLGGVPQKKMDAAKRTAKLKEIIDYIKSDNNWMIGIEAQAKERKVSVDSTIMLNAIYVLQQQQ